MKNTVSIMQEYLAKASTNNSGAIGSAFEIATRSYIMDRAVKSVKPQGKVDIRLTYTNGKRMTCEIKSACGEVETCEDAQLVIYAPIVDPNFPAESQGYVFTRDQWKAFLHGYQGRGKFLREDKARGHLHIQSFYGSETVRPKASKPIADYIWSVCYNQPTVDEVWER